MGLFTPKKDTASTSGLPEGYDDETSPYFIQPHLIEFWPDALEPATLEFITPEVYRLARDAAISERAAEDDVSREIVAASAPHGARSDLITRGFADATTMSQRISTLRDEHYTEYRQQAEHARRLKVAAAAEAGCRSNRESVAAARLAHTCPLCDEFNIAENGPVAYRYLSPAWGDWYQDGRDGGRSIRSCKVCHVLAVEIYMEQRAAQAMTPDGVTRYTRVRTAIATPKSVD